MKQYTKLPSPDMGKAEQGLHLVLRPTEFMLESYAAFGDHFALQLPNQRGMVLTSDPETIRAIFTGDPNELYAGKGNAILRPIVGSHSLLLLDGAQHKRDRKLMTPPFHGERMRAYGEAMQKITQQHFAQWPDTGRLSVHETMQSITYDVILACVFGLGDESARPFRQAMEAFLDFGTKPWFLLFVDDKGALLKPWFDTMLGRHSLRRRFLLARDKVRRALLDEIRSRRESGKRQDDILSLLLEARFEDGSGLTDEELHDEMITLLLAGHETTATSLSWLAIHLAQNPRVAQQMRQEVLTLGAGGAVDPDRLNELQYTFATIKESLRRTPILPIVVRELQSDQTLGALSLPAGQMLAPNIYVTHHKQDIWGDPFVFRPERFLDHKPKPWEFFPFGGGNRTCLGMSFAYYEMKIVASELVRKFELELAPGYRPRTVRRNITFAPNRGGRLRVIRRG